MGKQCAQESTCLTNCGSEFNSHNPPPQKMHIGVYTCEEIRELYSLVVSQFGLIFEDSEK